MNDEMTMQTETAVAVVNETEKSQLAIKIAEEKEWINFLWRESEIWAKGRITPQAYQNDPHSCFIAVEMSKRMNTDPMMVMQNMNIIKGKPCWSGQACIMLINNCGKFKDVYPVYTGERGTITRGCYFTATRISNGDKVDGTEVTLQMAKDENWTTNPKWRNMPEQMLAYRAAAFFARIHCPEALMGAQTVEEVQDVNSNGASALTAALKGGEPNA